MILIVSRQSFYSIDRNHIGKLNKVGCGLLFIFYINNHYFGDHRYKFLHLIFRPGKISLHHRPKVGHSKHWANTAKVGTVIWNKYIPNPITNLLPENPLAPCKQAKNVKYSSFYFNNWSCLFHITTTGSTGKVTPRGHSE